MLRIYLILIPFLLFAQPNYVPVPANLVNEYLKAQQEYDLAELKRSTAINKMSAFCFKLQSQLAVREGRRVCESTK